MVIVASSWFLYITLPTLMMHGQTQINNYIVSCVYYVMCRLRFLSCADRSLIAEFV